MNSPGPNYFTPKHMVLILLVCLFLVTVFYNFNESLTNRQIVNINRLTNVINEYRTGSARSSLGYHRQLVLSQHALDFMETAMNRELRLVLIDPLILYDIIGYNDRKVLIKNDLLSDQLLKDLLMNRQYCTAFAIFTDDVTVLKVNLSPALNKLGFNETLIEGPDGSLRHFTKNSSDLPQTLLHAVYTKDNDCIQISVLHKRHEFLWMGQVPDQYFLPDLQNNSKMFPKDLQYGRMESAFDSFNLTAYNQSYSGLDIHIPEPAVHFMAQIKTSTFIECNYEMAVNFHRQYKKKYTEGRNMDSQVKDALQALNHMARSLGSIPIYISSGTLLGWYRQCGVIPYTSDLDTATWAMYASNEATDRWLNNDVGFRLAYIYGLIENGYQYAFYSRYNLRVDVFYTYRELPNLTYTGHKPSQKLYFRYWYPYFELCSAELVGLKVQVPCTPESVVSAEYGPNFYTPVSDWNYMASAYNTGPHRYWANDEEAKRAYREF